MGILRSYNCKKHGYFDAWEPECPHGCKEVVQVFLKPFSIKSGRTKHADATLKGLAQDFGMTNIQSTREGEAQKGYHTRNNTPVEKNKGYEAVEQVMWGGGGRFNMSSALAGKAVQSGNGEPVGFDPKNLGKLTGPRAASYQADHQGLKINADS